MSFLLFRWIGRALLCLLAVAAMKLPVDAAPPTLGPCMLVTRAEVEQVMGKLKGAPRDETLAEAKLCVYESANGQG